MHTHMSSNGTLLTHPMTLSLLYPPPLTSINPSLLLTWRSLFLWSWCEYPPPSSVVSYQLFSPCSLTHPEDTPQIKLHIYKDDINISQSVWYKYIILWKWHFCLSLEDLIIFLEHFPVQHYLLYIGNAAIDFQCFVWGAIIFFFSAHRFNILYNIALN